MELQIARAFVEQSKVLINNPPIGRCVDSRYDGDQLAALAKPGADAGDLLIAFAALNHRKIEADPRQVLQAVVDNVGGVQNFRFHTDTEADPTVPGLGCAHLRHANKDPQAYGLKEEQRDFIFDSLVELLEQGAQQEVLSGQHAEKAVIAVVSDNYTLHPKQQAFVYHETLDNQRLERLGTRLSVLAGVDMIDVVKAQAWAQLETTLARIASSLPVYKAVINSNGEVSIEN